MRAAQPIGGAAARGRARRPGAERGAGAHRAGEHAARRPRRPAGQPATGGGGVTVASVLDDMGLDGVHPDQLVSSLSIGERQLVEIAKALSQRARVVILDEPTATLSDVETQRSSRPYAGWPLVAAPWSSSRTGSARSSTCATASPCCATAISSPRRQPRSSPSSSLIVQMLGEAPQPVGHRARPDPDLGHALRIEHLAVPGRLEDFSLTAQRRPDLRPGRASSAAAPSDVLRALAGLHPGATGASSCATVRVPLRETRSAAVRAGIAFLSNDRKSEGLFLDKSVAGNLVATRLPGLARRGIVRRRRERQARTVAGRPRGTCPTTGSTSRCCAQRREPAEGLRRALPGPRRRPRPAARRADARRRRRRARRDPSAAPRGRARPGMVVVLSPRPSSRSCSSSVT